jgi:hypothetical protein
MDISLGQPVTYRGVNLNDVEITNGQPLGCQVEAAEWLPAAGVGYTEKRAHADGADAGDVFSAARRLRLRGVVYGSSRGDTFDRKQELLAALNPQLAYAGALDDLGYQALTYFEPTADTANWPTGRRDLFINVRPLATPGLNYVRDRMGDAPKGFGLPWEVILEAIDPRIYCATARTVDLSGDTDGTSGSLIHRGDYPAPLTITLVSDTSSPQNFRFVGFNADITVPIPDLAGGPCTITVSPGGKKIVQLTYLGNTTLRMDLATYDAEQGFAEVAAGGGAYSWTLDGGVALLDGSELSYYEAFAG